MEELSEVKALVQDHSWLAVITLLKNRDDLSIGQLLYRAQAHFELAHFEESKIDYDSVLEVIFDSELSHSLTLVFRVGIRCVKCYTRLGLYSEGLALIERILPHVDPLDRETRALYMSAKEDITFKISIKLRSFIERTDEVEDVLTLYIEHKERGYQEGAFYYLISPAWVDKWQHWIRRDNYPYPGPINNEKLIVNDEDYPFPLFRSRDLESMYTNTLLKDGLKEKQDYFIFDDKLMHFFHKRYGFMQMIKRKAYLESGEEDSKEKE